MTLSEQQARAIAFLAAAARPHGARRWDEAGIYANIMKIADRSLAAVTIAVMQAAEDRNAHSPGVIPTAGPHWRNPESAPPPEHTPFDPRAVCHACGRREDEHNRSSGHTFLSVEAVRAIKPAPMPEAIREAVRKPDPRPTQRTTKETA